MTLVLMGVIEVLDLKITLVNTSMCMIVFDLEKVINYSNDFDNNLNKILSPKNISICVFNSSIHKIEISK